MRTAPHGTHLQNQRTFGARTCCPRDTARTMSQENVEVFKRGWDAGERRDVEGLLALLDVEVEWHAALPMLGGDAVYRGHDGVRAFLSDVWDVLGDTSSRPALKLGRLAPSRPATPRRSGRRAWRSGRAGRLRSRSARCRGRRGRAAPPRRARPRRDARPPGAPPRRGAPRADRRSPWSRGLRS